MANDPASGNDPEVVTGRGTSEHPPLFRRHVRRPRLTALLDDPRAQAIAVVAPPGYGKTVLVSEWAQGRTNVVWYRATPASADLAAFALAVAESAEALAPGTSERVRARLRGTGASSPDVLAELLAPAFEEWPADGVLVVDDYHLVQASRAAEDFTDWLLALTPVRLIATTRVRPGWASARRVLYGEVVEIGREQLALTEDETRAVLAGVPANVARAAAAQAQGWPALVGLAALVPPTELPQRRVSEALYRFFADEVLRRESPETQRFMTECSSPLTVDADTARVLGYDGAAPTIERLADEGLLEHAGGRYRFHPLLRDFLRRRLALDDPARALTLADAATRHALAAGRIEEAFELACEAERPEQAAEIAAGAARDLLVAGRTETLERWLERCGPAALLHSALVLARAAILLRRGEAAGAASLAQDVALRLEDDDAQLSRAWYVSAQSHQLLCRWDTAFEHARRASVAARSREDRTNALQLAILAGAALEIDVEAELAALEALAAGDLPTRFRLASAQVRVAFASPSLAGAWERVSALIPLIEHCDGPMLKSDLLAAAAYLNVLRGEYDAAAALAEHAAAVCADAKLRLPHAFSTVYAAAADVGRRRFGRADRALASVREVASLERHGLRVAFETVRLKLALAHGVDTDAPSLDELAVDGTAKRQRAVYAALTAVAHARAGDAAAARACADSARSTSASAEARFYSLFAEAAASVRSGGRVEAREVTTLLERAFEADLRDAFVVAYRAVPELLELVSTEPRAATLAVPAVRAAGDDALGIAAGLPLSGEGHDRHDALTPRESEVLALMGEGLSNAEIARRLYISPSTTKVHVHHILEKLGSKSRLEAVAKARRIDPLATNTEGGTA